MEKQMRLVIVIVSVSLLLLSLGPLGGWEMLTGRTQTIVLTATEAPVASEQLPPAQRLAGAQPVRRTPRVGASIALHPPKFWAVGQFINEWYSCPPAREAMSIFVVFWGEEDAKQFQRGMARLHPNVPSDAWYGVFDDVPGHSTAESGVRNQIIAAWKKWYGITYMMDMGEDAPIYGLMLDSELQLYNTSDCGPHSEWHRLYDRLAALEAAKLWPAAQVNDAASYDFGAFKQSGKDYDQIIIEDNAQLIGVHPTQDICRGLNTPGCREIQRQISLVLFAWWTDLPYVNLKVAERMLPVLESRTPEKVKPKSIPRNASLGPWCRMAHSIFFTRFEHIAYQQWCVVYEGYHFDDVTAVTDYAVWGSYLEDPKPRNGYGSSRLAELHPMWLPSDAYLAIRDGKVPPMSHIDPPLMYLHVDHHPDLFNVQPEQQAWGKFLEDEDAERKIKESNPPA